MSTFRPDLSRADIRAIRDLAKQDAAGETDDSFARTGDALDTIRRWRAAGARHDAASARRPRVQGGRWSRQRRVEDRPAARRARA